MSRLSGETRAVIKMLLLLNRKMFFGSVFTNRFLKRISLTYLTDFYEHNRACFLIIFVSDGKSDNSMGVRKRTD